MMRGMLRAAIAAAALSLAPLAGAAAQQLPQKVWTLQSPLVSLGYCQLTSISASTALTACAGGIPAAPAGTLGPVLAIVQPSASANYRDDGTAPSATVGMQIAANQAVTITTNPLSNFQIIPTTGSITVNVLFYAVR
jgi:hypothetical protein